MITKTGSDLLEKEANLLRTGVNLLQRGATNLGTRATSIGKNLQGRNSPFLKGLGTRVSNIGTGLQTKSTPFLQGLENRVTNMGTSLRNRMAAKTPTPVTQASTAINNTAPAATQAGKQPGFLWRNKGRIAAGGLTVGAGTLAFNANKDAIRNPQQAPGAQNLQQPNAYPHPSQQYF